MASHPVITQRLYTALGTGAAKLHTFLADMFDHRQLLSDGAILYGHLILAYASASSSGLS